MRVMESWLNLGAGHEWVLGYADQEGESFRQGCTHLKPAGAKFGLGLARGL